MILEGRSGEVKAGHRTSYATRASAIALVLPGASSRAYAEDSWAPPVEEEASGGSPSAAGKEAQSLVTASTVEPGWFV